MEPLFSPRANFIVYAAMALFLFFGGGFLLFGYFYTRSSYATGVGLNINQPIPFSHAHHVKGLGIDCRYCHATVKKTAFAGMPSTDTCMNCHWQLWTNADLLQPARTSSSTNQPIRWRRVNGLPDFVYFNHAIHVNKGVGCSTCHGPVDQMPLMHKSQSLFMEWCLQCHRHPENYIRPQDQVLNMDWLPPKESDSGRRLVKAYGIDPSKLTDCTICHR